MQYPFLARRGTQCLLMATCALLLCSLLVLYMRMAGAGDVSPKRTDFVPYFSASELITEGHGGSIYSFTPLGHAEAQLVKPLKVRDGVMPYLYPPQLAVLMAPLAWLPYQTAFLLWLLVNLALLAAALIALSRYLSVSRSSALLLGLLTASSLPILVALAQGQVSLLLLAAAASGLYAVHRERDLLGGIMLSVLAVKPTYLLPVLLVLVIRGRWRALGSSVIVLITGAALATILLGPRTLPDYARTLVAATDWQARIGGFDPQWNQSLAGLTSGLTSGAVSSLGLSAIAGVSLFVVAWAARRSQTIDAPLALGILAGLLASPHVLIHDLSLLAVPAAVFWRNSPLSLNQRSGLLALSYVTILVGLPLQAALPIPLAPLPMLALSVGLLPSPARPVALAPASTDSATPVGCAQHRRLTSSLTTHNSRFNTHYSRTTRD